MPIRNSILCDWIVRNMGYSRAESRGPRCARSKRLKARHPKTTSRAFLMATEWFYSRGGNQVGPVSSAELRACAERGTLLPDDWIWKQGMADWVPARRINGLFPAPTELSVLPEEPRHLPGLPSQPQQQAAVSITPQRDPGNWYFEAWRNWRSVRGRACRMEFLDVLRDQLDC